MSTEFLDPNIGPASAAGLGHFKDRAAFERFGAVYAEAFGDLPPTTERHAVDTAFGRVRAYRFGSGPRTPVVLLSGRNASTPTWAANVSALAARRPVLCLDTLGEAGCSTQTAPLAGPADHAHWVDETLDRLGIGPAHLVGASLGGWIALHVAIHRPTAVRSLTVVDPPATFARLSAPFIAAGLASSIPTLPRAGRASLLGWISGAGAEGSATAQARLGQTALETFRVRQPAPTMPTSAQLAGVRAPVLALLAGRSRVHDVRAAVGRAAGLPSGTVEVWPDASHALNAQFPQRFTARLERFLEGAETSPTTP